VGPELGVDLETLITEDDTPVDNMPAEKQQRLRAEHVMAEERRRAEQERGRAEQERRRAERLAALLRRSGIDPEQG